MCKGLHNTAIPLVLLLPQLILEFLGSNFAMSRGAPFRGERNGNLIVIDVPEKCSVLIQK